MNQHLIAVNQFILDATEAAARLDAVSTDVERETILQALHSGQKDDAALLHTLSTLPTKPNETALVNILLENLQARMKFLRGRLV
jgi:hypothetical protein